MDIPPQGVVYQEAVVVERVEESRVVVAHREEEVVHWESPCLGEVGVVDDLLVGRLVAVVAIGEVVDWDAMFLGVEEDVPVQQQQPVPQE